MKNIIMFNTATGSQNMGDYIICESAEREMNFLLKDNFVVNYATHTPIVHNYQQFRKNPIVKFSDSADYKFIEGTNILQYNMIRPWANLNINLFNTRPYKDVILIGAGVNPNTEKMNAYTSFLFKKILNKNYYHSVRDEKAKAKLEELGLNVINTGCPTLWMLTEEHCKKIPTKKSKKVIFTLTDYCMDIEKDQQLIDLLNKNYEEVYFWVQGSEDLEYFNSFKNVENIHIVGPNLPEYKKVLQSGDIDYIGTRLHAGVYAMQNFVRSIILIVDNRARDMKKSYNLPAIERDSINQLDELINSDFSTNVEIDQDSINLWKSQFK